PTVGRSRARSSTPSARSRRTTATAFSRLRAISSAPGRRARTRSTSRCCSSPRDGPARGARLVLVGVTLVELVLAQRDVDLASEEARGVLRIGQPVHVHALAFGDVSELPLHAVDRDGRALQHAALGYDAERHFLVLLQLGLVRALALVDLDLDGLRRRVEADPFGLGLCRLLGGLRERGGAERENGERAGEGGGQAGDTGTRRHRALSFLRREAD